MNKFYTCLLKTLFCFLAAYRLNLEFTLFDQARGDYAEVAGETRLLGRLP